MITKYLMMVVTPFLFWYTMMMLVSADWNISNWHLVTRIAWVVISIYTMRQLFEKF
jgi:hypothetical protein